MKKHIFSLLLVAAAAMVACSDAPQLSLQEQEAYKFADKLIEKMTLREKIGQLQQFTTRTAAITGPDGVKRDTEACIRNGEVGSFLSIRKTEEMLRLQKIAVEESRLGIPLIFGYDIIHGCRTTFPENLAVSCTWDIEAIEHELGVIRFITCRTLKLWNARSL